VILVLEYKIRIKTNARSLYRGNQDRTRIRAGSKLYLHWLYKRTSKERRKGNPPTPSNLSLYTLRLPPSNHSSCSIVPSEYPTMVLHTTIATLISTSTPHHPTSQHLKPLPHHNILYRHQLTIFPCHLRVYPHLLISVTLISSIRLISFLSILQLITRNLSWDRMLPNTWPVEISTFPNTKSHIWCSDNVHEGNLIHKNALANIIWWQVLDGW